MLALDGKFRVVGLIKSSNTNVAGYFLIPAAYGNVLENTKIKPRPINLSEFRKLLTIDKVVNFGLEGDKVVCTENSEARFIEYDIRGLAVTKKKSVILLHEVDIDGTLHYRIYDSDNNLATVTEEVLVKRLVENPRLSLVNGKVVNRPGSKPIISMIKGSLLRVHASAPDSVTVSSDGSLPSQVNKVLKGANKPEYVGEASPRNKLIHIQNTKIKYLEGLANSGGVLPINPRNAEAARKAKYFYAEFVVEHYPTLARVKSAGVHEIFLAASLLELFKKGEINSPNKWGTRLTEHDLTELADSRRKLINSKDYNTGEYTPLPTMSLASPEFLKVLLEINEDVANFFIRRNALISGQTVSNDPEVESEFLNTVLKRMYNADPKTRRDEKRNKKPYNTAELDYKGEKGLNTFGFTASRKRVGETVYAPLYVKPRKLKHISEVAPNLFKGDNKYWLSSLSSYGDFILLNKLLDDSEDEKLNKRLLTALIYLNNRGLYRALLDSEVIEAVSPEGLKTFKEKPTVADRIYYLSGGKFGKEIKLVPGSSWCELDLHDVPYVTSQAITSLL